MSKKFILIYQIGSSLGVSRFSSVETLLQRIDQDQGDIFDPSDLGLVEDFVETCKPGHDVKLGTGRMEHILVCTGATE